MQLHILFSSTVCITWGNFSHSYSYPVLYRVIYLLFIICIAWSNLVIIHSLRRFHSLLAQPWRQTICVPLGLWKGLSMALTHWGRVTHICVSKLTIIGSDNGLSPGRRQAIIWTNAGILLIGPLGTNFSEISSEINIFSFKKMHFKTSSAKWRPFCLGLNVLKQ